MKTIRKLEAFAAVVIFALIGCIGWLVYYGFKRIEYISAEQLKTTPTDVYRMIQDELHLRKTINEFGYCILEADGEGKITKWDEVATAMWGYTSKDVIGKPVEFLMSEKVRPSHQMQYQDAIDRGHGLRDEVCDFARHKEGWLFSVEIEIRVVSKDRTVSLIKLSDET